MDIRITSQVIGKRIKTTMYTVWIGDTHYPAVSSYALAMKIALANWPYWFDNAK